MNLSKIFKDIGGFLRRNAPEIMIGSGIAGMLSATIITIPATVKATKRVESEKRRLGRELTKKEIFLLTWKFYILPFATAAGGTALTIGGAVKGHEKNVALTAAVTSLETAAKNYKETVVEEIGEKKAEQIEQKLQEKEIKQLPSSPEQAGIVATGYGTTLFKIDRAYFRSTLERVKSNFLQFSSDFIAQEYMSKNDMISHITDYSVERVPDDNILGWNHSRTKAFELDDLVFRYYDTPWNEIVCVIDICDQKRPYVNYDKYG